MFFKSKNVSKNCCRIFSATVFVLVLSNVSGQSIPWVKKHRVFETDMMFSMVKGLDNEIFAGGSSHRFPNFGYNIYNKGFLMKIDQNGDSIFTREFPYGTIYSMAIDHYGDVRINFLTESLTESVHRRLVLIRMTRDGFIYRRDSILSLRGFYPSASIMGKDSSLIIAGTKPRLGFPGQTSMFFLRQQKDGTLDNWVELNPGHPNCRGNHVEQMPNGNYLVSGHVGSRIASYELSPDGSNPVFREWYQSPIFRNFVSGYVKQMPKKGYAMYGLNIPSVTASLDSNYEINWSQKLSGGFIPPECQKDGSILSGYNQLPYTLWRLGEDSTPIWHISLVDTLASRGVIWGLNLGLFVYFDDESAILGGTAANDSLHTNFREDYFFAKITNTGTPLLTLSRPKMGFLANHTLAPWPNPASQTLYLKQTFDLAEIRLVNLRGEEVLKNQVRFGQGIDVSALTPGLYFYHARIDGQTYSGKILKE
jgi:hypothetical protein